MDDTQLLWLIVAVVAVLFCSMVTGVFVVLARHWVRALMSGAPVSLLSILAMRMRGNPPGLLIDAYGTLLRAGVNTTISEVEKMFLDNKTRVRTSNDLVALVKSKMSK